MLDQSEGCTFEKPHKTIDNSNPDIDVLYEQMLRRVKKPEKAQRILHIVVGTAEPLSLDELNEA